jgi:hypothetical protein
VIPLSELTSGRETPGLTGQKIEELVNERQSAYEMLKTGSTVELPDGRKVRLETGGVRRTNANYQRLVSGEGPAPGPHTVVTDRNGAPITELAPAGESTLITNDTGVPLAEVWKDGGTGRTIVYMREGGKRVSARVVAQMPDGSTKIVDVSRLLNVRFTILPGTTVDATGSILFVDFTKNVDGFISAFLDVAGYSELEGLLNARVPGYSSMSVEQKLNHATRWAYFFAEQKVWLFLTDEETRLLVKMVQESPDINPDTKEVSWDSIRTICNAEAGKRDVRGWVTGKLTEYERLISVGQIEEAQTLLRVVNMALDEYRLGLERKDGNGYEWAVRDYEWVLNEMEDMYSRAGRLSDFRTAWGISVSEDLSSATWQADDGKAYTAEQNGEVNTPFHLKGVGTVRRAGTTYEAGITFDTPQDLFNKVFVFDVKLLGESYEGRRLQAMAEDEHGIVNDVSDRVDLYRSENKFIQWTSARIRFETPRVGGFNPRAVKRLYFVLDGNKLEDSDGVLTIRNPRIQSRPRLDGDAYVALYGQRESVIDIAAFEKSVQSRLQSLKIDLFLDFVKRALFLILGFIGVLKILDMLRSRRRGPASTTSAGTGTPSSTPPSSPTGGPATSGRTSTSGIDYGQVDSELGTIRDGLIRVFDDAHMRLEPDMYIGRTREKPRLFQINSLFIEYGGTLVFWLGPRCVGYRHRPLRRRSDCQFRLH